MWQPQFQTLGIKRRTKWKRPCPQEVYSLVEQREGASQTKSRMIISDTEKNLKKKGGGGGREGKIR